MKKFNYKKWVTENKHGKTLKESMYGDDATLGLAAKSLASKSDPSDIWNNYNTKQRKIIIDQSDLENDPTKQEALAQLSYDDLMKKLPKEDGYKMDQIILDGLTDDEMKRTSETLNEELDANKIKDSLKNLIDNSEVDSDVRSDLVGIILPSLEKANAPEELVKNLKILSNDFDTTDGVPYSRQPNEVKNAITYLTGDKAQKSVDQIGDVAGGYADALKPGTEKIYTATTFPDGLRDSDFYKKSVKDGWKFITKNSLTPDQEKIAKSLPTKSDGTSLKEKIQELSIKDQAKLYYMGLVKQGKIKKLPDNPEDEFLRQMTKDAMEKDRMKAAFERPQYSDTDDDEDLRLEPEDDEYEDGTPFYGDDDLRLEPEDDEYEDRTPFYGDDDDLRLEPEDDPRMDPAIRSDFDDPVFENYTKQSLLKALGNADDALIQTHVSPGEKGEGDYRLDGQEYVIYNPNSNNDDNAAMWNSDDYVVALDRDGEKYEIAYSDIMRINLEETRDEEDKENDRNLALDDIPDSLREMANELGYLKETTISRGIEVEVTEDSIIINGSKLKRLDIAYVEQRPSQIYRGYLHTDQGQLNLDGGESGLNEFLRAAGAPVDEKEYPHNIVDEYFMKYGVEVTTSEFDVS